MCEIVGLLEHRSADSQIWLEFISGGAVQLYFQQGQL